MDLSFYCPHCSKPLSADASGRMPPWCRHCGADIKRTPPPADRPPTPPSPDLTDRPAPAPAPVIDPFVHAATIPAIPCFHARSGTMGDDNLYRVYVTETDLLVFRLGPGSFSHGQFTPRTRVRYYGGGLAGAIGMWQESRRLQAAQRVRDMLESADEETLYEYAAAGDGGYLVAPEQIRGEVRIDPPSFWYRLFGTEHEGILRFRCRAAGRQALLLPTAKDVRMAAEAATRLFGDVARIDLPWAAAAAESQAP